MTTLDDTPKTAPSHREFVAALMADPMFDADYYAQRYMFRRSADRAAAAAHFASHSVFDLRSFSPQFDPLHYLLSNGDVEASALPPSIHYAMYGRREGRQVRPIRLRDVRDAVTMADLREKAIDLDGAMQLKVAICLHIYYADYLAFFSRFLATVPFRFDLFISIADVNLLPRARSLGSLPMVGQCVVEVVPNKGRNFLGVLSKFASRLAEYDLIGHAHSKKSLYTGSSRTNWGLYYVTGVLGGADYMKSVTALFAQRDDVGSVSADRHYRVPYWAAHWLRNYGIAAAVMTKLGHQLEDGFVDYPIGGMFWVRTNAIRDLLQHGFSIEDFPPETGQTDGTLQHALERLIGAVPAAKGYRHAKFSSLEGRFVLDSDTWLHDYKEFTRAMAEAVISNAQVVSFDLFDTLIMRDAADVEEAKHQVADNLAAWKERHCGYQEVRNKAERILREEMDQRGDVRLQDIAVKIRDLTQLPHELAIAAVSEEARCDQKLARRRESIIALYNFAIARGKKVIIASDTYYGEGYIRKLLSSLGVPLPNALYLSSERQVRKDRGDMWDLILASEGTGNRIVHFGDNVVSDVQNPSDRGIDAVFVCKATEKLRFLGITKRSISRNEWPVARRFVQKFGDDPFFG